MTDEQAAASNQIIEDTKNCEKAAKMAKDEAANAAVFALNSQHDKP